MSQTNRSFVALTCALFMAVLVALIGATTASASGSCGISGITINDLDNGGAVAGYHNISFREHITIDLADMPDNFNIEVEAFGSVESIRGILDGSTKIENHAPYRFPRGDHGAWNPSVGEYHFTAKAYKGHNGNGTRCDTDNFDVTVIDSGSGGGPGPVVGDIVPPTAPTCDGTGDFLWQNNINLNNLQGSAGIPEADVRLKRGNTTQFSIPNLPTSLGGDVSIIVSEAIAWDGYTARPTTGDQPNERYKIVFLKDGAVAGETAYTGNAGDDGLATGTSSAEWIGFMGGNTFPNGVDEILIVHTSDSEYGQDDQGSWNSLMPSSICFNIKANELD